MLGRPNKNKVKPDRVYGRDAPLNYPGDRATSHLRLLARRLEVGKYMRTNKLLWQFQIYFDRLWHELETASDRRGERSVEVFQRKLHVCWRLATFKLQANKTLRYNFSSVCRLLLCGRWTPLDWFDRSTNGVKSWPQSVRLKKLQTDQNRTRRSFLSRMWVVL